MKENAEYHAAKEEQSHNEGRIVQINDNIARANVIDVTKMINNGKVIFGSTVDLENLDTEEKITYKIVGKDEADLQKKLIFFQSPIGRGLIGKKKMPIMPFKANTLMEKYLVPVGRELGQKLKAIEEVWISNNFKISDKEVQKIASN